MQNVPSYKGLHVRTNQSQDKGLYTLGTPKAREEIFGPIKAVVAENSSNAHVRSDKTILVEFV